ncbi:MAG TPA: hypothetical protein VMW62_04865 [Chloroflexota bacterium]|nr:hypothetical protein [Chloroflexota bacterium]
MSVVAVLILSGIVLMGIGFSRGNPIALVVGGVLLADAMALYVIFGPAAQAARTIFAPR